MRKRSPKSVPKAKIRQAGKPAGPPPPPGPGKLNVLKGIERIVRFEEDEPFEILGPHEEENGGMVVRAFLPRAQRAWILAPQKPGKNVAGRYAMERIHPAGFFEAVFENRARTSSYRIVYANQAGECLEFEDPYAFGTEITDYDLYLLGEGTHFRSYEKLGAHVMDFRGVAGVHFAVWAPHAKSVSVVGNFNDWIPGAHPMTRIRFSGIWALFIPGLKEGEVYKFAVKVSGGNVLMKADPYAFQAELRPRTASVVAGLSGFLWDDHDWMARRARENPLEKPIAVYEVHLGSWARNEDNNWGFLDYRQLAYHLVDYVKEMGYTHLELMPVMEHPLDESWGYQVINYYAPSSRFGSPKDFMHFVDYCHINGLGVILDWVPAHFPRDGHGLADFDGTRLYSYACSRKGAHKEWGTEIFDFGKNEVRNFLISNALFWLEKYHVDGLRVDAVASMLYLDYARRPGEWEPNEFGGNENLEAVAFLKKFNEELHGRFPGILTIAEESTAWPGVSKPTFSGGLGFSMKWNMGWMHDSLEYFSKDPVYRKFHQGMLTFPLWYAFAENYVLPISHDEVVYGKRSLLEKMPGDPWQQFANLRLFLGWMFGHPGKKLLFMGQDFAHFREWNVNRSLDWHLLRYPSNRRLRLFVKDLLGIYRRHRALYEDEFSSGNFEWIDFSDSGASIFSFLRWSRDRRQVLVFAFNMTPVLRRDYRIGVPFPGFYQEILNSDAGEYGGSGCGNRGGVWADHWPWHHRPCSLALELPPLGVNIFCLNV